MFNRSSNTYDKNDLVIIDALTYYSSCRKKRREYKVCQQSINSINCVHSSDDVVAITNYTLPRRNICLEIDSIECLGLKHDRDDIPTLCLIEFFSAQTNKAHCIISLCFPYTRKQTTTTYIIRIKIAINGKI